MDRAAWRPRGLIDANYCKGVSMIMDPAIEAVAAYWEASDALDNMKRVERGAQFAAPALGKDGQADAVDQAAAEQGAPQDYASALLAFGLARYELCTAVPESPRGAIEMLTALRAEFSEPFDNAGLDMKVFAHAGVLTMIENIRDALELWESHKPPLKV